MARRFILAHALAAIFLLDSNAGVNAFVHSPPGWIAGTKIVSTHEDCGVSNEIAKGRRCRLRARKVDDLDNLDDDNVKNDAKNDATNDAKNDAIDWAFPDLGLGGSGSGSGSGSGIILPTKRAVLAAAASLWIAGAAAGGVGTAPLAHAFEPQRATVQQQSSQQQQQQQQPSSSSPPPLRFEYLSITDRDIAIQDNKKLIDYAVGTINTQFYDNSGGARFNPSDFYRKWKEVQRTLEAASGESSNGNGNGNGNNDEGSKKSLRLDTRVGTVETLKYLVSSLEDPYSKYMTREELRYEFKGAHDGFLGTGAYIEIPKGSSSQLSSLSSSSSSSSLSQLSEASLPRASPASIRFDRDQDRSNFRTNLARAGLEKKTTLGRSLSKGRSGSHSQLLTSTRVANLPVVTAVAPNSPAERAGLVVGDRIVAVGDDGDSFVGYGREEIRHCLETKWGYGSGSNSNNKHKDKDITNSNNNNNNNNKAGDANDGDGYDSRHRYFGVADLTIAKPVYYFAGSSSSSQALDSQLVSAALEGESSSSSSSRSLGSPEPEREMVLGYRSTKVKLPTRAMDEQSMRSKTASAYSSSASSSLATSSTRSEHRNLRGDSIVQYEMLTSSLSSSSSSSLTSPSSSSSRGGIFEAALRSPVYEKNYHQGNVDAILKYPVASAKDVAMVGSPYSYETKETPRAIGSSNAADNENNNSKEAEARDGDETAATNKVGYIRLTRFSKSSTEGYLEAVRALEDEDATSYIIDLRNNYGGVLQEAMLTASTLIGDPHAILCYLLNARGGFTPVDVESYAVDPRYPGYLLSNEPRSVVLQQVMREHPTMFRTVRVETGEASGGTAASSRNKDNKNNKNNEIDIDGLNQMLRGGGTGKRVVADWDPPSSYASIHEQVAKRGIHRISYVDYEDTASSVSYNNDAAAAATLGASLPSQGSRSSSSSSSTTTTHKNQPTSVLALRQRQLQQKLLQKDIVLLINEGTASSAEFFVAALQDNGRSVAVVGTKSFGKGLIQHTFPMPDGGGLKLTIGEFLRPSLRHVTNVFDAKFYDKAAGEFVGGGGIRPDVVCDSRQGIPGNPRADLCIGVALDVLEEHESKAKAVEAAPQRPSAS